jgi:hypothetical protein
MTRTTIVLPLLAVLLPQLRGSDQANNDLANYLLEIVPREAGEGVRSPAEVTVRQGRLTGVEITITRAGV